MLYDKAVALSPTEVEKRRETMASGNGLIDEGMDRLRRRTKRWILLLSVGIIISIPAFILLSLHAFGQIAASDMCENETLVREPQPFGGDDLVVFRRNCGATTGFSYHLSLLPHQTELRSTATGNVYVSEETFEARWTGRTSIRVTAAAADAFKRKKAIHGIRITYGS